MTSLQESVKRLTSRNELLHEVMRIGLGETAAPGFADRASVADATRSMMIEEYTRQIFAEYDDFAREIRYALEDLPPWRPAPAIPAEDIWLWGGPTPEWGGSSQIDTLPYNAQYFNIENGFYVYGPTSDYLLDKHRSLKKLYCMVSSTCRAPGQQPESDGECAENLSKFSLKFTNIKGGILDDMTSALKSVTPEKVAQIAEIKKNLTKHNPDLELFGVVYQHELAEKDFTGLLPYLDGVILWFWHQEKLLELEKNVDHCRYHFPKKKVYLGLFMHDYGTADAGTLPELLLHQLKGARQLYADGKIGGLVILGDREVLKWPEQAALIRGFLAAGN